MAADRIDIKQVGLKEAKAEMHRMEQSLTRKKINSIERRNAGPMLTAMKQNSPAPRIADMTAITTRQSKRPTAPPIGIRIGVINNDASKFPDFTAPALASVLEHGTQERFRRAARSFGISIGVASTGSVTPSPWLRPAWDANVKQFVAKTIKSFERQVEG